MKVPHERADETIAAEIIAELEDEATRLESQNLALQLEVKSLRRDLRRARRNVSYRLANGVRRALKLVAPLFSRNGTGPTVQFPKMHRLARNGAAPPPCSAELQRLLQLGTDAFRAVFFTSATERNWALHELLLRTPARQLCFTADEVKAAINDSFFSVPGYALPFYHGPPAFAHQELIVIDGTEPGLLWPLLKGRFWPHQKILFYGKPTALEFAPAQRGPDFAFYAAPPAQWLDPRHAFQPPFAPWKLRQRRLPARLPSGKPWPKISVVTPSFNQGQFIGDTFESIFTQQYPELEYLVLDGGSTDQTREILDHYHERLAYCCSQKDKGQADAINQGFARATGEIFAWLNSDDQYAPDALMRAAIAFDLFPEADVVVGGCGLVQNTEGTASRVHHCALPLGKVVPLPAVQLLDLENCWLKGHFFYQPEVFWRRSIWEAAGGQVSDDLYYCFDYDLWVRMAQAGAKVVHIPDLLALYRVHPAQKTYGEKLPYLPELKLVKSRRDVCGSAHGTLAKA